MPVISELYEPIADDLKRVCAIFDDELFSDLPVLNALCEHIRGYRGKMLRPALVLLSGRACGRVTEEHLTVAVVVELVHMATLVHDDVLDDADVRRRRPTVHRLEGNEAAVLLGDYLISHAFHLCSSLDSQFASRTIGATTNTVCEGELHQVHHRGNFALTEEQYHQIIARKTAALTATCCLLGAHFARPAPATVTALESYGRDVGNAFQITDDILDIVGTEESMGKTLGRDLEKRKLTLPIIHGLARADAATAHRLRELVQSPSPDRAALRALLDATESLPYARVVARNYVQSAIDQLAVLPPSDAKDTLHRMAMMIIEREQ